MNSLGLEKYISQYPLVLRFSMMLVFRFEIRSLLFSLKVISKSSISPSFIFGNLGSD